MKYSNHVILLYLMLSVFSLSGQEQPNKDNVLSKRSGSSAKSTVSDMNIPIAIAPTRDKYSVPLTYTSNAVVMPGGQTYTGSKKGITMWDNYAPLVINTENSQIPDNNVTALALDGSQNLWIGTFNHGVVIGVQRDIKPFKIKKVITHDNCVFSIYAGPDHLVWVVYRNGGIECFREGVSIAYFPS